MILLIPIMACTITLLVFALVHATKGGKRSDTLIMSAHISALITALILFGNFFLGPENMGVLSWI